VAASSVQRVRVSLIGPHGIFKLAILPEVPLTITTTPPVEHRERPYDDGFTEHHASRISPCCVAGIALHARTAIPGWLGERLGVGWAIGVLHPLAR